MRSAEIEVMNSTNPEGSSNSSYVIQVGYDVEQDRIFRMPKHLRDSKDQLLTPHLVSIGPLHHGNDKLKDMEKSKDEAVRRMEMRIRKTVYGFSMKLFADWAMEAKDEEIRKFYGEHISLRREQLARIVTRDACFLFEFLLNYTRSRFGDPKGLYVKDMEDSVFDVILQNPKRERLMSDLLLFENQIPLWVLKYILQEYVGTPEAADLFLQKLVGSIPRSSISHNLFMWFPDLPSHRDCSHFLEILYLGIAGKDIERYKSSEASQMQPRRTSMQVYYEKAVDSMKARCTHQPNRSVNLNSVNVPTASELRRAGVKILPVTEQNLPEAKGSGIDWIRFDGKAAVLYLPQIQVTQELCAVLKNIIAMELSKPSYRPRPITQYVLLMGELIDSKEDAAMLTKAEVIHNFLRSNEKLADFFDTLCEGITPDPNCKIIHEARKGLYIYTNRKYKILWSEFVAAYFSKPWLGAGSIAAVILLCMTVVQVMCLFVTCNR